MSRQGGFEQQTRPAERRDFFDIRRLLRLLADRVEALEAGGGGGGPGTDTRGFTFVQEAQPTTTRVGDTWWQTSTGNSFVWSYDGSSLQWVQFAPGGGGSGGGAGGPLAYVHNQGVAASTWIVTHNLGWYPNVTVVDSSGDEVEGDLTHLSDVQLRIIFSASFSGIAYLS